MASEEQIAFICEKVLGVLNNHLPNIPQQINSTFDARMNEIRNEFGNRQPNQNQAPPPTDNRSPGWKDSEVGFFDPDGVDAQTTGNGDVILNDVNVFIDRLKDAVAYRGEQLVRERIPALLRGSAQMWWSTGLDELTKTGLRHSGIEAFYDALKTNFQRPLAEALSALTREKYTLFDARNRRPFAQYVFAITRHARDAGMTTTRQQLTYAYNGIDAQLRQTTPYPTESTTIATFIDAVRNVRDTWAELAEIHIRSRPGTFQQRRPFGPGNNNQAGMFQQHGENGYPARQQQFRSTVPYQQNRPFQSGNNPQRFPAAGNPFHGGNNLQRLPAPGNRQLLTNGPTNSSTAQQYSMHGNSATRVPPIKPFTARTNHVQNEMLNPGLTPIPTYYSSDGEIFQEQNQPGDVGCNDHEDQGEYQEDALAYYDEMQNGVPADPPLTIDSGHLDLSKPNPRVCSVCNRAFPTGRDLHEHLQHCQAQG